MPKMTETEAEDVYFATDEGFDYAFRHHSSFKEIKDPEFHRLRQAYVDAANNLEKYIKDSLPEDFEV